MIQRTACLIARGNEPWRNLAIEKHLMDTLPENTAVLYLSQNRHTITVGCNQNPWYECKVESFLESGGSIARRLSGGGAMYQDTGCLNYSIILPKTDFNISRHTAMVGMAVSAFAVNAEADTGKSLMAGGRRFCSNAFYKSGSVAMQHGTILVQAGMDVMEHYLKPRNKSIRSFEEQPLRNRVVNLRDLNDEITIEALEQKLYQVFAGMYGAEPAWLDEQMMDSRTLEQLTRQFQNPGWVYPQSLPYNFEVQERFPWGSVTVLLLKEDGIIRAARIFSDAMEAALFTRIQEGLVGCPYLIGAINTRFEQRLELLRDPRLLQIAGDVCTLICGKIRSMDRGGEHE